MLWTVIVSVTVPSVTSTRSVGTMGFMGFHTQEKNWPLCTYTLERVSFTVPSLALRVMVIVPVLGSPQ